MQDNRLSVEALGDSRPLDTTATQAALDDLLAEELGQHAGTPYGKLSRVRETSLADVLPSLQKRIFSTSSQVAALKGNLRARLELNVIVITVDKKKYQLPLCDVALPDAEKLLGSEFCETVYVVGRMRRKACDTNMPNGWSAPGKAASVRAAVRSKRRSGRARLPSSSLIAARSAS